MGLKQSKDGFWALFVEWLDTISSMRVGRMKITRDN